jgi:endonuclease YncB( thermonuclease family)
MAVAALGAVMAIQSCDEDVGDGGDTAEPSRTAHSRPADVPGPPPQAEAMRVRYVFDGDTVELQAERRGQIVTTLAKTPVRLIGVDTPEMRPEPECYGRESTAYLRTLLPEGTRVLVDRDHDGWDDFDRRLLFLWLEDGRFVNYEIVAHGYAEAIRIWPNDEHYPALRSAQEAAQAADAGLWRACPQ